MAKRVPVLAPDPKTGRLRFATVDESEADLVVSGGGKLLTKAEADTHDAEIRQTEREDKAGIAGKVSTAVGAYAGALNPLMYSGGPGSTGEAYNRGVTHGATAGLNEVAERKAIDATAGPGAGAKFAQQLDDVKTASPYAHGAGEMMGLVGGTALGAATPAGAIGRVGGALEGGANFLTKGLAARGALGKAAATGIGLGVRGATEGAIYSGVTSATDDMVHDHEVNGEKLYTAIGHGALAGGVIGGGLGFTGSLAASGAKAAKAGIVKSLSRGASEAKLGGSVAEAFGNPNEFARGLAHEQAWKAVGGGFGLQSTRYAKEAAAHFPGGTKDIGEIGMRYGVLDTGPQAATPLEAAWHAAKVGTPAEMLPRAEAALDGVGKRIGAITESSGARVNGVEIMNAVDEVAAKYESAAATKPAARSVRAFAEDLRQSLGVKDFGDTVAVQDLLRERKAMDRIFFADQATMDPKLALELKRNLRGKIEGLITEALDGASGKVPGELAAEYKALKKDFHGLRILEEAAEDSAARAAKGATLGLGEKFAVASSVASGHFAAAPVLGLGGKMIRERGNAAAAAFLSRAADRGTFAKLLRTADEARTAAVKGVLAEAPAATAGKAPKRTAQTVEASQAETVALRSQADAIMQWQGQVRANPKRMMDALAEAAEVVGRTAGPRTASAYTSATIRAFNYISRYVPVKDRRDPLDPRSVPPLTYDEADRLVRAHKYATEPGAVWKDFGRGIITPEGLDWANEVPEQFAEFRTELLAHVTEHMLKNKQLSQSHRLRIDKLLGVPAGPDLRPDAIARHQADFLEKVPDDASGPQPPQTGGQPVNMKISQAGFDAVEARKSG